MAAGLPLANPAQSGVFVQGQVYQAYGNWIGENMSLTLEIVPAGPAREMGEDAFTAVHGAPGPVSSFPRAARRRA